TSLGNMNLRTCLLPEREAPYLLSLELARHRIMLFLNKLEDWAMFDLGPTDPVMAKFNEARTLFTQALVAQRDQAAAHGYAAIADRMAWQATALCVQAGELLTMRDAQRDLPDRISGKFYARAVQQYINAHHESPPKGVPILPANATGVMLPGRPILGCTVNPNQFSESLQKSITDTCDFISLPMRWNDMEPTEGKYAFQRTDRWIEWAVRKARLPVAAGPVVDFRAICVPEWLYIWENDYETLRELVYEHIRHIVTRYRRTVSRWTIASGLHVNTNFQLSFEQMMDLTRVAVLLVRKLHPSARIELELTQPWGEYFTENRRSLPPYVYAEMAQQAGINVDGYGLRLQLGQPEPGQGVRDLMAIASMLDRFANLEKPISISSIGVPSMLQESTLESKYQSGVWHAPWTPETQCDWLTQVFAMALSKPFIHSICWHELADAADPLEMPGGGTIGRDGAPKPALRRLGQIRDALRDGHSPFAIPDIGLSVLSA
ncbi:MAG: endo-1,4-beta-xylanase, partial [Phycisphaerales bacterium]|nr:endo-1,4-beta-xylanase [Phycisphaerales bacterium]